MTRSPPADFFLQNTVEVARQLIGTRLTVVREDEELAGRIVETEAYRQDDPASHSYRGRTPRSGPMFEAGGIAYVYFIYGMHNCFNVVTEPVDTGCAVLVRAVEPVAGLERMWKNRFPDALFDRTKAHTLANGPGKLCRAFGVNRTDNRTSLITGSIRILLDVETSDSGSVGGIGVSRRIGIRKGAELPWRFYEMNNPAVSSRVAS